MIKKLVSVLVLVLVASFSFAQEETSSTITSDGFGMLSFSQRFNFTEDPTGIANVILGLRGGVSADLMFKPSSMIEVGGELGMLYMSWESDAGSMFLGDFPLAAKVSLNLGGISLEGLAGALFTLDMGTKIVGGTNLYAGSRLILGSIFIEGDYVFATKTVDYENAKYLRVVVGYRAPLLK